jgi:hypothetical protein
MELGAGGALAGQARGHGVGGAAGPEVAKDEAQPGPGDGEVGEQAGEDEQNEDVQNRRRPEGRGERGQAGSGRPGPGGCGWF